MSIVEGDIVVWRERGYTSEFVGTVVRLTPYDDLHNWVYVKNLKSGKLKRMVSAYLSIATPHQIATCKLSLRRYKDDKPHS